MTDAIFFLLIELELERSFTKASCRIQKRAAAPPPSAAAFGFDSFAQRRNTDTKRNQDSRWRPTFTFALSAYWRFLAGSRVSRQFKVFFVVAYNRIDGCALLSSLPFSHGRLSIFNLAGAAFSLQSFFGRDARPVFNRRRADVV